MKFYTVKEVAKILRFHTRTIQRWIKEGRLKATKVNNRFRIHEDEFNKLIESFND